MLRNPFVLSCVFLLLVLAVTFYGSRGQRRQQAAGEAERTWMVQCPRCERWKRMKPLASDQNDEVALTDFPAAHPGAQYQYTNQYKCPFCGHRWQESYLE